MIFRVIIEPHIPESPDGKVPFSLNDFVPSAKNLLDKTEYYIDYEIDGKRFGYDASTILTILNDLHLEWELTRAQRSHEMTLCGYTVLQMEIDGDSVRFFSNTADIQNSNEQPIDGTIKWDLVEATLRHATAAVWRFVSKRNEGP